MSNITIDEDLELKTLQGSDAEALFQLLNANREYLREWLPWLDANTQVDHTREFIKSTVKQEADNLGPTFAIMSAGQLVGVVGYHPIRWSNRSVEIGYWLSRNMTGQGLVTRCCRVLVDHAFNVMGLNRVTIPAAVENRRSRAIPERLGFKSEGIIRDAEWLYDHYVDHVLYAMLKREWKANHALNGTR